MIIGGAEALPDLSRSDLEPSMPSSVSIVILNWNGAADTIACLDSLRALTFPTFSVVVVDNGSTDDSALRLRSYVAPYSLTLLEAGRNLGYAGGNNFGIRHALRHGADFVLVLNNDTAVAPDILERLLSAAERNPDAGVFSARIMYFDDPKRVWFDGARWNETSLRMEWQGQGELETALKANDHDTDYACGAALFFRAQVPEQIGLLDEAFFLVWEEVDWCYRARKAGFRIVAVPAAKVWHKIGVSFGTESSPLRTYFSVRNEFLWLRRHAPLGQRMRAGARRFRRLIPKFSVSLGPAPRRKRLLWALQDYARAWMGRGNRLEYLVTRRAIVDYLRGRFGDCPDEVRILAKRWSEQEADGARS